MPLDDLAGDIDEHDVCILGYLGPNCESGFGGEVFAVHQDAFGLADGVPAAQCVAQLRHAGSADQRHRRVQGEQFANDNSAGTVISSHASDTD